MWIYSLQDTHTHIIITNAYELFPNIMPIMIYDLAYAYVLYIGSYMLNHSQNCVRK